MQLTADLICHDTTFGYMDFILYDVQCMPKSYISISILHHPLGDYVQVRVCAVLVEEL